MKLPLIPIDRANHFIYGFVIFILANLFLSSLSALFIVVSFAVGKEVYDYKRHGEYEISDAVITIIPATIMYALIIVYQCL